MKNFLWDVVTDKDQGFLAKVLRPILWGLTFVYRMGLFFVRCAYKFKILRSYRSDKVVISVGNITVGGVGKTPLIVYLAKALRQSGRRVVVLTRGYMGEDAQAEASDEAAMLREQLGGISVYANPNRVEAIELANKEHLVDVFLLDDGFQHWPVERDLDIVAIDAANPFGNRQLIPRGILREPLQALERADIFVMTRVDMAGVDAKELRKELIRDNPRASVAESIHAPVSVKDILSGEVFDDLSVIKERVCAFCAIGSPENFKITLTRLGCQVDGFFEFIDHHVYSREDVLKIANYCREKKINKIVTTHKDAVKMSTFADIFQGFTLFVLNIEIKIVQGENELLSRINSLFLS